jgi:prepilin-type N-terminal cleavage/methylation domain-containing protein
LESEAVMNSKSRQTRLGFSLIELLVVIAVIGILIGLLMPAVQAARRAAAETQSKNNLKQLGVAMHSYHEQHSVFPASFLIQYGGGGDHGLPDPDTGDAGPGWGWGAMLLPQLEAAALHDQLNFDLPCWVADNATAVRKPVSVFLSPTMSAPAETFDLINFSGTRLATFARSSYVANAGRKEPWGYAFPGDISHFADGPMYRNSKVRVRDVTDGLAKTVFIGEHHAGLSSKTWVGVVPGAAVCPTPRFSYSEEGCDFAATLVNVHSGPADNEIPPRIHPPSNPIAHVCMMWSENPDGCNVLMGDGSVNFVSSMIDPPTWAALSTHQAGDLPGSF